MLIEGNFNIKASQQRVWDFLQDINAMASCVKGFQSLEVINDKVFDVTVKEKIGIISVCFKTRTTISSADPPNKLESISEGVDSIMGSTVEMRSSMELEKVTDDETELIYKSDVKMNGRLAKFAQTLLKIKAKAIMEEFAEKVNEKLSSSGKSTR